MIDQNEMDNLYIKLLQKAPPNVKIAWEEGRTPVRYSVELDKEILEQLVIIFTNRQISSIKYLKETFNLDLSK